MSTEDAFEQRISDAISDRRIANQRNKELIFDVDIVFRLVDHIDEGVMNGFFGVVLARCPSADTSQSLKAKRRHGVEFDDARRTCVEQLNVFESSLGQDVYVPYALGRRNG